MNVRATACRRQAKRLHWAAAARLAALSRETGVPVDVLRTLSGIGDPRNAYRFSVAAFHARGEAAWQHCGRTGAVRTVDEVFDSFDARFAAAVYARRSGRREIEWSAGAALAKDATSVEFPPPPPAEDWD